MLSRPIQFESRLVLFVPRGSSLELVESPVKKLGHNLTRHLGQTVCSRNSWQRSASFDRWHPKWFPVPFQEPEAQTRNEVFLFCTIVHVDSGVGPKNSSKWICLPLLHHRHTFCFEVKVKPNWLQRDCLRRFLILHGLQGQDSGRNQGPQIQNSRKNIYFLVCSSLFAWIFRAFRIPCSSPNVVWQQLHDLAGKNTIEPTLSGKGLERRQLVKKFQPLPLLPLTLTPSHVGTLLHTEERKRSAQDQLKGMTYTQKKKSVRLLGPKGNDHFRVGRASLNSQIYLANKLWWRKQRAHQQSELSCDLHVLGTKSEVSKYFLCPRNNFMLCEFKQATARKFMSRFFCHLCS